MIYFLEFTKINLGIACVIKEFSKRYLDKGELYELRLEKRYPENGASVFVI